MKFKFMEKVNEKSQKNCPPFNPLQLFGCPKKKNANNLNNQKLPDKNQQVKKPQNVNPVQPPKGENHLMISANCVHVNVFMPNQTTFNIPVQSKCEIACKALKNVEINTKSKEAKEIDNYWKPEKKEVAKKDKKVAKLFDPPWNYKGHQPRSNSESDHKCCPMAEKLLFKNGCQ